MNYLSTRGDERHYSSAEAILLGIAPDGGLFVPESIPRLDEAAVRALIPLDYPARVAAILRLFLTDYSAEELLDYACQAYSEEKFAGPACPLVQLNRYNPRLFMLELWHGPTAAFKDMALQLLPYLMTAAMRKTGESREVVILTATSGDTGKAALEGFKDVPGTQVVVYYPEKGVARAQALQMLTTTGENCHVVSVEGSFDDAQNGVKRIFADRALAERLAAAGKRLSSANSINWGRLVPQIAYYWSAYADLLASEAIAPNDTLNVCVPTGNFGNILAAWYAQQMGLPINKLVCASNRNNVLSDFLASGQYNARRSFFQSLTPSMDILISSNLERLLFELSYQNPSYVRERMDKLKTEGGFSVGPEMLKRLHESFVGGFTDDRGTLRSIGEIYDMSDYVIDPHTAVGFNVYQRYERRAKDEQLVVFVATASPFKFPATVCRAIFDQPPTTQDELALLAPLAEESGLDIPSGLKDLAEKEILHHRRTQPEGMAQALCECLGL